MSLPAISRVVQLFTVSAFVSVRLAGKKALSMAGMAALAGFLSAGTQLPAQTAHFSGSVATLGSGFDHPEGVAVDANGNVFVCDTFHSVVKEILAAGGYTTINTLGSGFNGPSGIAVDGSGNLFVTDWGNNAVKEIVAAGGYTTINTLGSGFNQPYAVAVDGSDNVFVTEVANNDVKEILAAGGYTTIHILGSGFNQPFGLALDANDNVFVADTYHSAIKEILAAGGYTTINILGSGFSFPAGLALDGNGNVYVSDWGHNAVKEILAGSGYTTVNTLGSGFNKLYDVAVDGIGNVFVADTSNNAVKEIVATGANAGSVNVGSASTTPLTLYFTFDTAGTLGSTAVLTKGAAGLDFTNAGTGTCTAGKAYNASDNCTVDVTFKPKRPGPIYGAAELLDSGAKLLATGFVQGTGVGPLATFATNTTGVSLPSAQNALGSGFDWPFGVAVDGSGNVFVADSFHNAVKEILAAGGYTTVKTLGSGFSTPRGVAVDGSGNVFVAGDDGVKEIVAVGGYTTINALVSGFSSAGVAVDGSGNVFISDFYGEMVKEIVALGGYTTINTLAVANGHFSGPYGLAVDGSGNIFVANYGNSVKEILAAGGYTAVNTLAGGFNQPTGVAVDASGNVFVADFANNAVKEIVAAGGYVTVNTLGSGYSFPSGIAVDGTGNIFITDTFNNAIKKLTYADAPGLSFAATDVGSQSSDSPQMVSVSNNGNAALVVPVPSLGQNPSIPTGFSLDGVTTCPVLNVNSSTGTLAPGESCDYAVDFIPQTAGNQQGLFTLTDGIAPSYATQAIQLTGTGLAAAVPPSLTLPAPSSTLSGSSATFSWNPGVGNSSFLLHVGTTGADSSNVYAGAWFAGTSVSVSNIPANGVNLYVRLYYIAKAVKLHIDYVYTEAGTLVLPSLTLPVPGSTLTGSSANFVWNPGAGPTSFLLRVGTTGAGSSNVNLGTWSNSNSAAISNIPTNGVNLYVRLFYLVNGMSSYIDYVYTEAGTPVPPSLTSPAPGSTLTGSSANFVWNPGAGPTSFLLRVGTTGAGSSNIYSGAWSPATSANVINIPVSGQTVYVRLFYLLNGLQAHIDYTVKEQ